MKRTVEQYFCDVCGDEFIYRDTRWLKTGGTGVGCIMDIEHMCPFCHKAVEDCVKYIPKTNKLLPVELITDTVNEQP